MHTVRHSPKLKEQKGIYSTAHLEEARIFANLKLKIFTISIFVANFCLLCSNRQQKAYFNSGYIFTNILLYLIRGSSTIFGFLYDESSFIRMVYLY